MKHSIATLAAAAVLTLGGGALAADLPRWNLEQACAAEANARAYCVAFENRAFGYLNGIWPTLKPEIRDACLQQVDAFGQQSYRLLEDCVEERLTDLRVGFVRDALRDDVADPPSAPPLAVEPELEPEMQTTPAEAPGDDVAPQTPTAN